MSRDKEQEEAMVRLGGLCRGHGVGVKRDETLVVIWVQLQPHRSHLLLTQPLSWGRGFPHLQPWYSRTLTTPDPPGHPRGHWLASAINVWVI